MRFSTTTMKIALALLLPLLIVACGNDQGPVSANTLAESGGSRESGPPIHYEATIEDALGFTVEYGEGYKVLKVFSHWDSQDASDYHREYLLVPAGLLV